MNKQRVGLGQVSFPEGYCSVSSINVIYYIIKMVPANRQQTAATELYEFIVMSIK